MSTADSPMRRSRRMFSAGILLALLFGVAALLQPPEPVKPVGDSGAASPKPAPREQLADHGEPVVSQGSALSSGGLPETPVAVAPGHEGHGDECAQCLAERKLAVYREDFAQLHFTQASEGRVPTPEQARELLAACRRFAMSALREWSFSDARPRLADDGTLEKLRSEMLQPLIEQLPTGTDEAP